MPATSPEDVHAEIEAAINAGDMEAFLELHEEGAATVQPPEKTHVAGREAIRAAIAPIFALKPVVNIDLVGKVAADGLALTHALWRMTADDAGGRQEISGRGTIVSRAQPDGTWRIVLENSMSFE